MSKERFHPKVSIVIPVYNGSNYLREAIDSALAQTYGNFEVIVVNDGSTDDGKTDRICISYGNNIRYFKKENGGVASALNLGIKEMRGEYFSWLSHDDLYYPNKLEKQIDFLSTQKNKDVILYANVSFIDLNGDMKSKTNREEIHDIKHLNSKLYPAIKGLMNGCVLLIPKKVFTICGKFDESLKTANDYDMWFRISREFDLRFQSDVLIKYRIHKGQGTRTMDSYYKESDIVWSKIIKDIKPFEIKRFEKSLFIFYNEMYFQMQKWKYYEAADAALAFCEKYYKPEELKEIIDENKDLKRKIKKRERTLSWRITKPLRHISKVFRTFTFR